MAKEEAAAKAASEQLYPLAELKSASAAVFGVKPEVIDGALYGNAKTEFTITEMRELINGFLKRKVQ